MLLCSTIQEIKLSTVIVYILWLIKSVMIHRMKKLKAISFLSLILVFSFFAGAIGEQISTSAVNSQGTIIYPPSAPVGSARGELYLWLGFWMSPGDSTSQRIVNARQSSGIPIWIDTCNFNSPQITSSFINYFHAHGVKVVARLWSRGGWGTPSLNTILHDMNPNVYGGSVDKQMFIGPEIDAFMIDEASTVSEYNFAYYKAIIDYVHSLGKLCFLNLGVHGTSLAVAAMADKLSVEFSWWGFINNAPKNPWQGPAGQDWADTSELLALYPEKFIGVSNDWGYKWRVDYAPVYDNLITPISASGSRPAWVYSGSLSTPSLSLARAVWDVKTGWAGGVYCMQAQPDQYGALPSWWEQYVAGLRS